MAEKQNKKASFRSPTQFHCVAGVEGLNGPQASAAPPDLTQKRGVPEALVLNSPLADMLNF